MATHLCNSLELLRSRIGIGPVDLLLDIPNGPCLVYVSCRKSGFTWLWQQLENNSAEAWDYKIPFLLPDSLPKLESLLENAELWKCCI